MISVIIPMYNVERYIKDCLISLENQYFKEFEVVIVNDGSCDSSKIIVEKFMVNSDINIKLIDQDNCGVSIARNKGIENASGTYVCFVDSDDMVAPNYLSDMIKIIENDESDMVICGTKSVSGNINFKELSNSLYANSNSRKMNTYEALRKFLYREITPGVGSFLIKKEILLRNNLNFEENYRYSEDIEFIYKILNNSNQISYTNSELYLYRIRIGSAMGLVDEKRKDGYLLMQRLESYFHKSNPDFAKEFKSYGVARWVWATLWQIASASKDFKEFKESSTDYDPKYNMKALLRFPKLKVSLISLVYIFSPYVYYKLIKVLTNFKDRQFHTSEGD